MPKRTSPVTSGRTPGRTRTRRKKRKWGYFPVEGHPEVVKKFEGTTATPEFLQALAYEDGSRGRDVLTHFLGDAELKSIMTDGYNAYVYR